MAARSASLSRLITMSAQERPEVRRRSIRNLHLRKMTDVRIDNQLGAGDLIRETSTIFDGDQPIMVPVHDKCRYADGRELTCVRVGALPVLHVRDDRWVVGRMAEISKPIDHRRIGF